MTAITTDIDCDGYERICYDNGDYCTGPLDIGNALGVTHRILPFEDNHFEFAEIVLAIRETFAERPPFSRDLTHLELWGEQPGRGRGLVRLKYDGELPSWSTLEKHVPYHAYPLAGTYPFVDHESNKWANPDYVHHHTIPDPDEDMIEKWIGVHAEIGFYANDVLEKHLGFDHNEAAERAPEVVDWLEPGPFDDVIVQARQRLADTLCLYDQWSQYDDSRPMLAEAFGVDEDEMDFLIDDVARDELIGLPDPSKCPKFQ